MTLTRFANVVHLNTDRTADPLAAGIERFVGLEHIEPENLHIRSWGLVADGTTFTNTFQRGQALFGKRRAYQRKVAIAEFDGVCSSDIYVFESKEPTVLLPKLLPFILQSEGFYEFAVKTSAGSLSPRTNWTHLANYEFPLPPVDEQRRIADLLWAADDAIDANKSLLEQARLTKTAWFEDWISNHLDKKHISRLGNAIVEIVAGKSPQNGGRSANEDEYGVLKVSAVGDFGFVEEENKVLLKESDYIPDLEVKPGYLLVTRANALLSGIGRACYVKKTRSGLMLSDKTLRLVVDYTKTTDVFLFQALKCSLYRNHVEKSASGTEAKNISQEKLAKAPIPLPPLAEQKKIEEVLSSFDSAIESAVIHLENSQSLKKQILSHHLGG